MVQSCYLRNLLPSPIVHGVVEQKGGLDFRMVENTGGGKAANSADVNSKCMDEEGNLLNALSDVCSYLLNEIKGFNWL